MIIAHATSRFDLRRDPTPDEFLAAAKGHPQRHGVFALDWMQHQIMLWLGVPDMFTRYGSRRPRAVRKDDVELDKLDAISSIARCRERQLCYAPTAAAAAAAQPVPDRVSTGDRLFPPAPETPRTRGAIELLLAAAAADAAPASVEPVVASATRSGASGPDGVAGPNGVAGRDGAAGPKRARKRANAGVRNGGSKVPGTSAANPADASATGVCVKDVAGKDVAGKEVAGKEDKDAKDDKDAEIKAADPVGAVVWNELFVLYACDQPYTIGLLSALNSADLLQAFKRLFMRLYDGSPEMCGLALPLLRGDPPIIADADFRLRFTADLCAIVQPH